MKIYFYLFSLFLFTACGGDKVSSDAELQALEASRIAQEAAYEGVTNAHDRIMPRMGEVTAAQRAIKERLEAGGLADDTEDLLEAAYEELEDAEDGMMEWMRNLKSLDELRETMNNDAIISYIRDENAEIAEVETAMTTSIANAKKIVGDHSGHNHGQGGHNH